MIVQQVVLGKTDVEIADSLGVTAQMVRYTRESPIVKEKIAVLRGMAEAETIDIAREIRNLTPVALAVLEEFLLDPNHDKKERRNIAQDLLNRDARSRSGTTVGVSYLTGDDIKEIKMRAKEEATRNGQMVDATYEEMSDGDS